MRSWPGSWRWIALVLLAWGTLLFYIGGHLVKDNEHAPRSSRELAKILTKLERLKQQNEDLRRMAQSLQIPEGQSDGPISSGRLRSLEEQLSRAKLKIHSFQRLSAEVGPGREQEELRRKVENGVRELWYFIRSEIQKLSHIKPTEQQKHTDMLLQDLGHQQRTIMTDLYQLSQADGAGDWRKKEARDLSSLVQNRISYLQNPQDCSKARKLVCNINKGCGYGCQLHHVVYCFMIAYGTQRVLILESHNWRYAPKGWETVFRPVSDTCTDRSGATTGHWSGEAHDYDVQVVELPIVDSLHPRPPYLPLAIPEDLAPRLQRLHGDPSVWWVSQFVKYLVRPQAWLEKEIQDTAIKLGFKHPIVGVHVRRTDKVGTEAAFHPIEEYMAHVEEQFEYISQRVHVDKRRVYLATDDPSLLEEAKTKYTDYEFISDNSISWSASLHNRYTENSLRGVILDIHFLSQTDFLVCTFSSQVCRVAYEIMQTLHPDASSFFRSLDDIYYFGGQNAHNQIAIYPHEPRTADDIPLEPGDLIGVAGNHWDGYSKGVNRKLARTGLYPSYKVKEKIETVKYPTYSEADKLLSL
ncbi:alpha-(1,6)-fucosyltransferase-like [Myxocyprinus asiaticus]|uniref:alpha-(1,6)-fucosyltransferase-like n=1 Tax=Myxocyprinus asiaticus TaxID=70543 RepID=UPI0022231D8A|nr:alpha-(1,6)-fucosyltransferase-like [Myxocyprinus asiaticus]XP_051500319.1 alpha-(1,6)-fucosyltransferase-like [Myxocyprinus asiaticus]